MAQSKWLLFQTIRHKGMSFMQGEGNKALYKRRQAIVEQPYGTIKRQWGFSYIMTKKSLIRANSDVGLIMTAYNFRRIINILGVERLRKYLEDRIDLILSNTALLDRILAHTMAIFGKTRCTTLRFKFPAYRLSLINISPSNGSF